MEQKQNLICLAIGLFGLGYAIARKYPPQLEHIQIVEVHDECASKKNIKAKQVSKDKFICRLIETVP